MGAEEGLAFEGVGGAAGDGWSVVECFDAGGESSVEGECAEWVEHESVDGHAGVAVELRAEADAGLLRCESGELDMEIGDWWTEFADANAERNS